MEKKSVLSTDGRELPVGLLSEVREFVIYVYWYGGLYCAAESSCLRNIFYCLIGKEMNVFKDKKQMLMSVWL